MCPIYLIDHPNGVVLYDTGLNFDLYREPGAYNAPYVVERLFDDVEMTATMTPVNRLDEIGYNPGEVDYVVLSHLHYDHAGNVRSFPDAEFLVAREELRYAWWPDPGQWFAYVEGDFYPLRRPEYDVAPVHGEYDVFGDGRVVCVPTPGHQALHVQLAPDRSVILAGDTTHLRSGFERELCTAFDWNMDATVRSIRSLRERARVGPTP